MAEKVIIKREHVKECFDGRFVRLYDLQYAEGRHYFDASRRAVDDIFALKDDEEFKTALPDAVTVIVIVKGETPRLLLSTEFRYPTGQFLLGAPAGLIDEADKQTDNPLFSATVREVKEETGISIKSHDQLSIVNPLLFSTPGLSDECNALICALISEEDLGTLSTDGAEGTEVFGDFKIVTKEEAVKLLKDGRDEHGIFYSMYTWAALMYFVSDMWRR
ncbi:MAG: NUDIX hydrolase [Eubacteriales bacterium]|nr:NUDIX hydrolase [Eubacteriales bacterium]